MPNQLTARDAYVAMYAYLEKYYQRTGANDIGAMLGEMSLLADGGTADPAVWNDWLDAVAQAISGKVDIELRLDDRER
jgi:hypothetical protein